jgi:hypothetical protein
LDLVAQEVAEAGVYIITQHHITVFPILGAGPGAQGRIQEETAGLVLLLFATPALFNILRVEQLPAQAITLSTNLLLLIH